MKWKIISDKSNQIRLRMIIKFLANNHIWLENLRLRLANYPEKLEEWNNFMKNYKEVSHQLTELHHENKDKIVEIIDENNN